MTSVRELESAKTVEVVFAGDDVRLAGQIDYPHFSPPPDGYPLLFFIHHAGGNRRSAFAHYTQAALEVGYAVFRWDKRGTGRSGGSGRGSATQDAVNAYETALEQPKINRHRAVILAQCSGSVLFGSAFGLFARVEKPHGVILAGNKLDETEIQAIDTNLKIIMGEQDFMPWEKYGKAACEAHNAMYKYHASYYVAPKANRLLVADTTASSPMLPSEAKAVLQNWLTELCPISAAI